MRDNDDDHKNIMYDHDDRVYNNNQPDEVIYLRVQLKKMNERPDNLHSKFRACHKRKLAELR